MKTCSMLNMGDTMRTKAVHSNDIISLDDESSVDYSATIPLDSMGSRRYYMHKTNNERTSVIAASNFAARIRLDGDKDKRWVVSHLVSDNCPLITYDGVLARIIVISSVHYGSSFSIKDIGYFKLQLCMGLISCWRRHFNSNTFVYFSHNGFTLTRTNRNQITFEKSWIPKKWSKREIISAYYRPLQKYDAHDASIAA